MSPPGLPRCTSSLLGERSRESSVRQGLRVWLLDWSRVGRPGTARGHTRAAGAVVWHLAMPGKHRMRRAVRPQNQYALADILHLTIDLAHRLLLCRAGFWSLWSVPRWRIGPMQRYLPRATGIGHLGLGAVLYECSAMILFGDSSALVHQGLRVYGKGNSTYRLRRVQARIGSKQGSGSCVGRAAKSTQSDRWWQYLSCAAFSFTGRAVRTETQREIQKKALRAQLSGQATVANHAGIRLIQMSPFAELLLSPIKLSMCGGTDSKGGTHRLMSSPLMLRPIIAASMPPSTRPNQEKMYAPMC